MGRRDLLIRIRRVIERQSILLTAERRMGKTCTVRKFLDKQVDGEIQIYRDVEGVRSAEQFVEAVAEDLRERLSLMKRFDTWLQALRSSLPGLEVGGNRIGPPPEGSWKRTLQGLLSNAVQTTELRIHFFWDEIPLMLENIRRTAGEEQAMELLDVLRAIRHEEDGIRMVFTGSIGLHNVLKRLRYAGYTNPVLNDLQVIELEPLVDEEARELVERLLRGEGLQAKDKEAFVASLLEEAECIPYFIHHVIDRLTSQGPTNVARVKEIVEQGLRDPHDGWNLRHYRDRLRSYYDDEERPLALGTLDVLAGQMEGKTRVELEQELAQIIEGPIDKEQLGEILDLLKQDHYVKTNSEGRLRFAYEIVRRWWCLDRGIE